jgi:hypothetical protein
VKKTLILVTTFMMAVSELYAWTIGYCPLLFSTVRIVQRPTDRFLLRKLKSWKKSKMTRCVKV